MSGNSRTWWLTSGSSQATRMTSRNESSNWATGCSTPSGPTSSSAPWMTSSSAGGSHPMCEPHFLQGVNERSTMSIGAMTPVASHTPLEEFLQAYAEEVGGVWDEVEPQVYDLMLPSAGRSDEPEIVRLV